MICVKETNRSACPWGRWWSLAPGGRVSGEGGRAAVPAGADARLFPPGPGDGELYSGTSYNFLGSEPIISRNSSHSPLRTEYAIPWLNGKKRVVSLKVRFCTGGLLFRGAPRRPVSRAFFWLDSVGPGFWSAGQWGPWSCWAPGQLPGLHGFQGHLHPAGRQISEVSRVCLVVTGGAGWHPGVWWSRYPRTACVHVAFTVWMA